MIVADSDVLIDALRGRRPPEPRRRHSVDVSSIGTSPAPVGVGVIADLGLSLRRRSLWDYENRYTNRDVRSLRSFPFQSAWIILVGEQTSMS